ncbi:hypothetical protein CQW23_01629 [Capsicum baccatum]|uniref:Ubiquitin-like protease family profile domain-containing protein n=1 Tax=Capsicum baccatum TaxID=33114 RepID=A0A2G2XP46_CAPBA|nr:hypothetical protein CQW23_01629 [Capsicum baccatum]
MSHVLNVWMYECCSEVDSTIAERIDNVIHRIFNWKVVGIKVKYEKFMAGMFSKFVYTNLRSNHEEVQRLDLLTIDGVELNNDESSLSHDTYPDHSERLDAPTLTPLSSGKSSHQDISDQKWNELKFFLQSYDAELGGFTTGGVPSLDNFDELDIVTSSKDKGKKDDELGGFTTGGVPSVDNFEEMNIVTSSKDKGKKDFEGFSLDVGTSTLDVHVEEIVNQEIENIGTAILNALVDAIVNQNPDYSKVQNPENIHEYHSDEYLSTLLESAQLDIDAKMQDLAAPVDDISLEVVKPMNEKVNLHSLSDSQIASNYPDSVVAAHLAAKILLNEPGLGQEFSSHHTRLTLHLVQRTLRMKAQNSNKHLHLKVMEYLTICQVLSLKSTKNGFLRNFHWVLAVIALKDRRIHVYDLLSNIRNMDSYVEIQKLAVMLPTFLSGSEFFEQTSRTDWPNLDAYRDKLSDTTQLLNTNPFEVEYVQNISQQDCDKL